MAERKVISKYYPPDYDESKIVFYKGSTAMKHKVRLMAPFNMRCTNCGNYIYKGTKFNARKEKSRGENYLGIQVYRFFIRCPACANEIAYKTDPKNADYVCEFGASRNFEAWREEQKTQEEMSFRRKLEEEMDPMKKLENRTMDSKREIEILEELDEVRTRNALHEKVASGFDLEQIAEERARLTEQEIQEQNLREEAEIEAEAKAAFANKDKIIRLREDPPPLSVEPVEKLIDPRPIVPNDRKRKSIVQNSLGIVKKVKNEAKSASSTSQKSRSSALSALVNTYGSDSNSDS